MTATNRRVRLGVRYPGDGGIREKTASLFPLWVVFNAMEEGDARDVSGWSRDMSLQMVKNGMVKQAQSFPERCGAGRLH